MLPWLHYGRDGAGAFHLDIPANVRRNAALIGEPGYTWLAELPRQIAELERRWAIKVGQPVHRGSEAFVAEARTGDGLDVIVKIVVPGIDPMRQELRIVRAARGRGYARLICSDEAGNAMLLEKLGPPLHELHLPEDRQIQIICATLDEAWRTPPEGLSLPTGADKAVEMSRSIEQHWISLGKPCPDRTIERALSYAERRRRAFDPAQSVLVHGDAHEWNTLKSSSVATGFKFVDPDGAGNNYYIESQIIRSDQSGHVSAVSGVLSSNSAIDNQLCRTST